MKYLFRQVEDHQWGWDGVSGVSLTTADDFPRLSASIVNVTGRHGRVQSSINDRLYFVLEGSGSFSVGSEEFAVVSGDVILVPRSTPYDFWSDQMRILIIDVPAFDATGDVSLQ
jgi:mannose-6-phosphate isomerase-like protein (cupin superfamily)